MTNSIKFCIVCLFHSAFVANCINYELEVFRAIFANYSSEIRPVEYPNETITVSVQFGLNSLQNIDEINEVMEVVGFFRTKWIDKTLMWQPSDYGDVTHIVVLAKNVWLPDIALSNSASLFYYETHKKDFRVRISHNGSIEWTFGGVFTTGCDMQLSDYPFDTQMCNITIETWLYRKCEVNVTLDQERGAIELVDNPLNSLWRLQGYEAYTEIKYKEFSSISFSFTWQRKSSYYVTNIILPTILIVFATFGVNWLPAECGEKVSLAITVLLALTVFQIVVLESTPVNSDDLSTLIIFILGMMFISSFTLWTSILVVYISGREHYRRAPQWLRTVCLRFLAKVTFVCFANGSSGDKEKPTFDEIGDLAKPESSQDDNENGRIQAGDTHKGDIIKRDIKELLAVLKSMKHSIKDESEEWQKEWKHIGIVIDRTALYFSAIFFIIFTTVVFSI